MNDHPPWEFTCKTCGGHKLTVTRVWNILAGPESESWQEWGLLEADHHWHYEYKERVEEKPDKDAELGDFGEFIEDDSASEPEEYEIFEPENNPESDEFYVNCARWIGRSNLAGHSPTVAGEYFPWNVQTSFRGNIGRNPDIYIPGRRSNGSDHEIASHNE